MKIIKMINVENLENGIRKDWNESRILIELVTGAVESFEEIESKKREGVSDDLLEKISERDSLIRKAAHAVSDFSKKYQILTRPINFGSFQDCLKVLMTLGSGFETILGAQA